MWRSVPYVAWHASPLQASEPAVGTTSPTRAPTRPAWSADSGRLAPEVNRTTAPTRTDDVHPDPR
ncbi:hypothetical protein SAMN05421805_10883 [Saccharopolyspora antimicrobica]|uniref:Uncharacterized protein n=1 Tax=Saccharopolyspora antimicrobica TaxID=455193 RepID=A0A1I5DD51_9PSEU|nr:hypothetical protein ATL45_3507 [Saccharopolyspora antimicrobica]SFN96721.1 hypothetical protein SAMN05421805_10883 [Saccharopolyspora antimicrobica]